MSLDRPDTLWVDKQWASFKLIPCGTVRTCHRGEEHPRRSRLRSTGDRCLRSAARRTVVGVRDATPELGREPTERTTVDAFKCFAIPRVVEGCERTALCRRALGASRRATKTTLSASSTTARGTAFSWVHWSGTGPTNASNVSKKPAIATEICGSFCKGAHNLSAPQHLPQHCQRIRKKVKCARLLAATFSQGRRGQERSQWPAALRTADMPNGKDHLGATQRVTVDRENKIATGYARIRVEASRNHIPVAVIQSSSSFLWLWNILP